MRLGALVGLPLLASAASLLAGKLNLPCGNVLYPGDPGFENATRIDNGGSAEDRVPSVIVQASCAEDVPVAMAFAREAGIALAVKGGGHSAAGYCLVKEGLVLDMSLMNASRINDDGPEPTLTVQAGAIFETLYSRLVDTGYVFPGGGCSTVGVTGFVLGGGLSFLSRAYGLASDNLLSLRLVTANGTALNCSDTEHAELFWALRGGGGGNFGIVLDMTLRVFAQPSTHVEEVCWHGSAAAQYALPRYTR